jgi:hypothetical protein
MYVPLAMGILEAVPWRKKTLFVFEAASRSGVSSRRS